MRRLAGTRFGRLRPGLILLGALTAITLVPGAASAQGLDPPREGLMQEPPGDRGLALSGRPMRDPPDDNAPAWSPDGTRIAFSRTSANQLEEIYVMNADGSGQRRLTRLGQVLSNPDWSPDGTKIAFDGIHVMNADGSGQTRLPLLTGATINHFCPQWSPDGMKLAFSTARASGEEISIVNADGSAQTVLARASGSDQLGCPVWLPDGTRIAFTIFSNNIGQIYLVNPDGSGQTRFVRAKRGLSIICADWSSNGKRIAYEVNGLVAGGSRVYSEIWVTNADQSGQRKLTRATFNGCPAWSPDGTKIAFDSSRGTGVDSDVYVMNANGSGLRQLTRP